MKTLTLTLLLVFLSAVTAKGEELAAFSLDDATRLGTTIQSDASVKTEGRGSVRISTLRPTTICLAVIPEVGVDNSRLLYRAKVKSEDLRGAAFLEMWCRVEGSDYFSRGMDSVVTGTMEWKDLETPFILQPGQRVKNVTLNIVVNGRGTVWVDDVRLWKQAVE